MWTVIANVLDVSVFFSLGLCTVTFLWLWLLWISYSEVAKPLELKVMSILYHCSFSVQQQLMHVAKVVSCLRVLW